MGIFNFFKPSEIYEDSVASLFLLSFTDGHIVRVSPED
jgi:hypothetical protein